nr:hypothetical protein [Bradyrhizobium sp. WSM2793]
MRQDHRGYFGHSKLFGCGDNRVAKDNPVFFVDADWPERSQGVDTLRDLIDLLWRMKPAIARVRRERRDKEIVDLEFREIRSYRGHESSGSKMWPIQNRNNDSVTEAGALRSDEMRRDGGRRSRKAKGLSRS